MVDRPKPYTSSDLINVAIHSKLLDPLRVVATYANQDNWYSVHQDQRHHWAWGGPVIVGWELADTLFCRHVPPQRRYVVYGNGSSGDYDTLDEALAVLQCNRDAGDDSVRLYVEMDIDDRRHVSPPEPVVLTAEERDDFSYSVIDCEPHSPWDATLAWITEHGFALVRTGGAT